MKKHLVLSMITILGVTLLMGCESTSSKVGTVDKKNEASTSSNKEDNKVVIGLCIPLTGNSAEYGQQFQASAELVQADINAKGGIKGKTLELKIMDSKNDAKEACDIARIMTEDKEVLAVIGDFSSTCSMAAAPIYQEAEMVMCSPSGSHPDLPPMGDYIFAAPGMQSDESIFAAKAVKQFHGFDSTSILYLNNDWGVLAEKSFKDGAAECGLNITLSEAFVAGETDFKTILAKSRQTAPKSLTLLGNYNELGSIVKQVKDTGWDVPIIISGSSCTNQFIELTGEYGEGVLSETTFFFEKDNKYQMDFYDAFKEKVGFAPTVFASLVHDTLEMFCQAAENTDDLNRKTFRDAIASYKEYSGIMGPLVFNEEGAAVRDYRIAVVKDGEWKPISDYGALK